MKDNDSQKNINSNQLDVSKSTVRKVGILGGGQLGRMLLQAAANYPVETYIMEKDSECPSAHLCHHFIVGDIQNYQDVYQFGKQLDALTIEIEHVNEDALFQLEKEGVAIFPSPSALKTIKNKILQKQFYQHHQIPSSEFIITNDKAALLANKAFLPAVQKLNSGGYDGKGVMVLHSAQDLINAFDEPAVVEKLVAIDKEIAVMIARNTNGNVVAYDPVEMVFNPSLNLLDYQISPAAISDKLLEEAKEIAMKVVTLLDSPGIFAVEMFIDKQQKLWVNETAPRVHNSGHHTIEAAYSSQFDMLWRVILGYPLGNTNLILPSALVNIIGAENFDGAAIYQGLEELLKEGNVFVHLYGKQKTKPGRKMGHVNILSNNRQQLIHQSATVRRLLKVISN